MTLGGRVGLNTGTGCTIALGGELGGVGRDDLNIIDSGVEECSEELPAALTEHAYSCCAKESPDGCE